MKRYTISILFLTFAFFSISADSPEVETAMFGQSLSRNMVSSETNLPDKWDVLNGTNIKWSAKLGSQSYAGPVVAAGKVFMGTNNENLRNPNEKGDRGVMMAFDATTGKFLWQATHEKLPQGRVNDWPYQGVCSTPFVEGDRMYYVSNRAELVCLDTEGFMDKENDGPVIDEKDHGDTDADVIWKMDMINELDVFPHNLAASSPLVVGDLVFLVTGNGVDEGHTNIPSPQAPSFIAVNKKTGKVVWEDSSPQEHILHGQWSNPTYGVINGKPEVIFPGGNGWLYAFEPETGKPLWKFDCNPKDAVWDIGGAATRNNIIASPVVTNNKVYVGVGEDPEHGEGIGHLWAIDASKEGDITESGKIWHLGDEDFHRTLSTVAILDGLLYASDLSGFLYCLDAETGKLHWKHEVFAAIWGSPFVADGKIYLGDEDGDVAILKTGKEKQFIGEINMGASVYTTPTAKNGVLYIATRETLYAIEKKQ